MVNPKSFFKIKITNKLKKFIVVGLSAALVNIFLMMFFVELCHFNTSFLKNIANVLAIFLSVIYNFIFSRVWTWNDIPRKNGMALVAQFISFNVVNLIAMVLRIVLFAVIEKFGFNYLLNVIVGIVVAAAMSFFLYDRIVFNKKPAEENSGL